MRNESRQIIRVAFVIGGLPFGGVENWLYDLCSRLEGDGEVVAHVINVSGTGLKMPEYEEAGFRVTSCGTSKKAIKTSNFSTVFKVRRELTRIRPHVVHTLQFSGDYFGRLAALGLGIPVVTHIRNVKSERKPRRRLFNKLLSYATARYLSVSKAAAKTIDREHNVAGRPVDVLYNAVEPAKLDVAPHDLAALLGAQGKVVMGVGRLVEQKNFDKLIQAMALVRKTLPETSLVILGDGGQREYLEQIIREEQMNDSVFLAGYIPNQEVPKYLRAAHVLAMPSDYEGLPVTHVEAMFCGLPAVISEHVPSIEIAPDCSLVCTTQVESIAEKLHEILSDDQRHGSMSEIAVATAQEFTMEKYLTKLKAYYRDLLNR